MKILIGTQIREADLYTIRKEPISSLDLMERASREICDYIVSRFPKGTEFVVFVGKGNNGGDGLVVARLLSRKKYRCTVVVLYEEEECSQEYKANYRILPSEVAVEGFTGSNTLNENAIIIDAMLGTGVKGNITPPVSEAVEYINLLTNKVISIDMPSGMTTEFGNKDRMVIKANLTLTMQFPKLSLLLPECGDNVGELVILPIGLDKDFMEKSTSVYNYITAGQAAKINFKRTEYSHKGKFGHALLICGKKGMIGAAVLSASSALRSGCGLVTIHVPEKERSVIHITNPSAIVSYEKGKCFTEVPKEMNSYSSVGIGCGIGTSQETVGAVGQLLKVYRKPMVIDADALNILSQYRELLSLIPENSVLTPHLGELVRLLGKWKDDEDKIKKVIKFADKYNVIMVIKGAHTMICLPDGKIYFNSTGNPGMAKGGSGDVLTGLITGYIAKGLLPEAAAIKGVFDHGKAGDDAAHFKGVEQMNSMDIVNHL